MIHLLGYVCLSGVLGSAATDILGTPPPAREIDIEACEFGPPGHLSL